MTADERSDQEPLGEKAPPKAPEDVAGEAGQHEYPTLGSSGDMTDDDESLARRPSKEGDEVDGDPSRSGIPPGSDTHGA